MYIPYQDCPPGLHITLGIFYHLWCLLEMACHELDLELATRTSPRPTDRKSFQHYSALVKQLAELTEKKTGLMELTSTLNSGLADLAIQIPDADSHPLVKKLKEEALSSAKKLDEVVRICIKYKLTGFTAKGFRVHRRETSGRSRPTARKGSPCMMVPLFVPWKRN